ncbi:Na/Pi cotransporter family protein [Siccirubricoccus phaeus]|uniref:Na/Pi cotransporter family protein n=1 Tax=Siccirubricoccus phaeus TaxID=2595053 RepID=UPI0011F0C6BA|nr:Na/Pi cotransporter family protein [Siccirubricoccus phaeus]
MTELRFLVELAGEAALLLWGLHMVQSGVQRAFGDRLRRWLGIALGGTRRAFLAGLGVTALLQSSTATAMLLGSFAAAGAVTLGPALAALLGANLGTALIVQLLSFNAVAAFPALVLAGVLAFRRGSASRVRDLGRVAIGLGLMLLALHLMLESLAPVEASPGLKAVLAVLADRPLPNLLLAALLAWAAHSSIAALLVIGSLAGNGVLGAEAALAMVLGANLGSALNPVLEAGGDAADRARLRLPLGNLANRMAGCLLGLAVLPWAAAGLAALDPSPVRLVANAHLGFNLAMALLAWPLLRPLAALLQRLLPERQAQDEAAPRYLEAAALTQPNIALANATREILRMADTLEAMLQGSAAAFAGTARDAARAVGRMDDAVDALHRAVHDYLGRIDRAALEPEEAARREELQAFAIAIEHAADVVARDLTQHAAKRLRRGLDLAPEELADLAALHEAVREQLRLVVAVLLHGDAAAAKRLVRGKEALRGAEREAVRRLTEAGGGAAAGLLLDAVRDLRRVGGHLAAAAYPLLERRGELLPSRLVPEEAAAP